MKKESIIVAIIGLIGVMVTGFTSNYDKIFKKDQLVYSFAEQYTPSNNFDQELRIFFEKTGLRESMQAMFDQELVELKNKLAQIYPNQPDKVDRVVRTASHYYSYDYIISKVMPLYRKHYTLDDIESLNKVLSTPIMRKMAEKEPIIMNDILPIKKDIEQEVSEAIIQSVK